MRALHFLALAIGAALSTFSPFLPHWAVAGALVPIAAWLCWLWRRRAWLSLALASMAGSGIGFLEGQQLQATLWPSALDDQPVHWVGCVNGFPAVHVRGMERDMAFPMRVIASDDASAETRRLVGSGLRLNTSLRNMPVPGQCYLASGKLRRPRSLSSPGAQAYDAGQIANGISANGRVISMSPLEAQRLPGLEGLILRLREAWMAHIEATQENPLHARLLRALTAGDDSRMQPEDWQLLQDTGTTHLFVISGQHIALAALGGYLCGWGIGALLGLLWHRITPWPVALALSAMTAWLFCGLSGAGVPALRAAVMVSAVVACMALGRMRGAATGLWVSACLIVTATPWVIYLAGFWLSFGAVTCLWLCLVLVRAERGFLMTLLRAQWAVGIGLVPVVLWFGKPLASGGWLVNLFAVPFIDTLVSVLFVLLPLSMAIPATLPLVDAMAWCLDKAWLAMQWSRDHGLSHTAWLPQPDSCLALGLMALAILGLLLPLTWHSRALAGLLLLPWLFPKPVLPPPGGLIIHVLDVGQGLSVVVQTHSHTLLYDAGPAVPGGWDSAEEVIWPFLSRQGIRTLDRIVISHADQDHAGGLAWIAQRFPQTPVWQTGLPDRGQPCEAGQGWQWDGVAFQVLHPVAGVATDRNNGSCVVRIELPGFVALLPGDIEKPAEYALVERVPELLKADWLVAAHHGSRTSSSWPWLKAVQPLEVVFSVGYHNRFHHPVPDIVQRWQEQGVQTARTDHCGTYTLETGPGRPPRIHCHRQSWRPYWRED